MPAIFTWAISILLVESNLFAGYFPASFEMRSFTSNKGVWVLLDLWSFFPFSLFPLGAFIYFPRASFFGAFTKASVTFSSAVFSNWHATASLILQFVLLWSTTDIRPILMVP